MRALVIGADGFAGRWLVRHLVESGDMVWAVVGLRFTPPLEGPTLTRQLDVRDVAALSAFAVEAQPEAVYYLAGVSGPEAREDVEAALAVTVVGSMHAMLASSLLHRPPRLLFVSTGYVYRPSDAPVNEEAALDPTSLYAAAKLAAERALTTMSTSTGVDVVIARSFNHTGPGQRDSFLVPTIARQVSDAGGRLDAEIRVRDASVVRDFTDVRDVVRAYRLLAERGITGHAYNVASGVGASVMDLAETMARQANVAVKIVSEARPPRPHGTLIGDATKMHGLGWRPTYRLSETLGDVLLGLLDPRLRR